MEGPGMSLFQGAASIHINNSAQDRLEEQEELEDQKRRNEELKHKLANAFDDLVDDDEASSVNSSGNFTLDAGHTNGGKHTRTGLPSPYVELQLLKEQHCLESPKIHCEIPNNHHGHLKHHDEPMKLPYSPYGSGDGYHCIDPNRVTGNHNNGMNDFEAKQEYMNNEKLKVLYEMRVKECQQLATQMEKLETEIDSLRARLSAAVTDRDRVELSLQEAHHLLASSKHKLIELEQQVSTLTQKLIENEQEKEQLKLELKSANITIQDIQQRLQTLQVTHSHDTDALFRDQQDRHREEVDRLHSDLVKVKSRLDEKENELKSLELKCLEKDKEKANILIEKGSTINRLASELEVAQSRLMSGETAKLMEKVSQLSAEKSTAKEQVKELGSKLKVTAHELVLCRSKLTANQKEFDNWRTNLQQILYESLPDCILIGDSPSPSSLSTLKDILSRFKLQIDKINNLQEDIMKRDKKLEYHRKQESELRSQLEERKDKEMEQNSRIAMLQNKLELLDCDSSSEGYKHHNEILQEELNQVRNDLKMLDLKYTELEMDYNKLKAEKGTRTSMVQEANADLLRELEKYNGQLKDTLKENGELKTLYLQACSSRDTVSRELKEMQSKMQKEKDIFKSQEQEYVAKMEKNKLYVEKLTTDLSNCKEELERTSKCLSELQKEFTDKQKEFSHKLNKYLVDEQSAMRKEMEQCAQCEEHLKHIRHLDDQLGKCSVKLATQESNEALMKELKSKAEFFQQYIMDRFKKLNEQRSVATNTEGEELSELKVESLGPVHDVDDAIAAKTAIMVREKAIRDQIAEKYTLEMKTLEMNNAKMIKEMENKHVAVINQLKELLERKVSEVEALKNYILTERAKVTQILDAKEKEISVLIKEHNEIQNEYKRTKASIELLIPRYEKYKERANRLGVQETDYKKEQDEMKQQITKAAKEYQEVKNQLGEQQLKYTQIENIHDRLQTEYKTMLEKYKRAKKTVMTYKEYIAKKDAHVNNELNRLQDQYRIIFLKLQSQLNSVNSVNRKIYEEKAHGRHNQAEQIQNDFTGMIKKLNDDFTKLTVNGYKDPEGDH